MSRCRVVVSAVLFLLAVLCVGSARAEPLRCPARLAFVGNDPLTTREARELKSLYARIGCPDVVFVGLPGRRGITAFNTGEVDGEMMRLPDVEADYTRPFLRMPVPITRVTGRMWARGLQQAADGPFGYVLGVVWQEQYGRKHGGSGYHDQADLYRAYTSGLIDRFLAEEASVASALKDGRLRVPPVPAGDPLVSAPLHHYLGSDFALVMAALAAELARGREDAPSQ